VHYKRYIDLQAGAEALADMSDGKMSAPEALSMLIRTGLSDEYGELAGLTPADTSDMADSAVPAKYLRDKELTDLIGSEDEFREPYIQDEYRRNNDDYQYALSREINEINNLIEQEEAKGNREKATQLRKVKRQRAAARPEEEAFAGDNLRMSPKKPLEEALLRLQMGTNKYGYHVFPGSADVAGRLEEVVYPRVALKAQKDAARRLEERDSKNYQPFWRNVNDVRAIIRYEQALRNGDIVAPDLFNQPNKATRPYVVNIPDQEQLMRSTGNIPYGPLELNEYGLTKNLTWQNVIPRAGRNVAPPASYGPVLPARPHQPYAQLIFDALQNQPPEEKIDVSVSGTLNQLNSGIDNKIRRKYKLAGESNIQNPADLKNFAEGFLKWAKQYEQKNNKSPISGWRNGSNTPISVDNATLADVLSTAGLGRQDQNRLGLALSQVALSGGVYGPQVAMKPASIPSDPRRQITRTQDDIGFEFDLDGGTKGRNIEYKRIQGDNRAAPGTRGIPASVPPRQMFTVVNKKGESTQQYGRPIFDQNKGKYVPMRRTELSKLFDEKGVGGPQALLAEDVDEKGNPLARTKQSYNKYGVTESPRELRKLIVDQAAERAAATGKELDLYGALQNADKAIAVTRRARIDNAARKEKNRSFMRFGPYNRLLRGGF
jgi:hypothetical protein